MDPIETDKATAVARTCEHPHDDAHSLCLHAPRDTKSLCSRLSVSEGFLPSKSITAGGSWTEAVGASSVWCSVDGINESPVRIHGSVWSLCAKKSGMIFTKFKFLIVSIPRIKSISESSAIRTGREKVYFKESFLQQYQAQYLIQYIGYLIRNISTYGHRNRASGECPAGPRGLCS